MSYFFKGTLVNKAKATEDHRLIAGKDLRSHLVQLHLFFSLLCPPQFKNEKGWTQRGYDLPEDTQVAKGRMSMTMIRKH